MAVAFETLTVNPYTLVGANPSAAVVVTVRTNTGGAIIDADANKIFLGTASASVKDGGVATFDLPVTNGATNPTGFQYTVDLRFMYTKPDGTKDRDTWNSGWFSFTADANLADVTAEQYAPPTWQSAFIASMDEKVTAAEAAQAAAEQSAIDASNFGLNAGTATALAPGADPTLSITGTAPSRQLNLGIPAGLADDASMEAVRADPASAFAQGLAATIAAEAVLDGAAFADIAKQVGVDNTGTTECAAAIQTALDGFLALGVRAYAKGTFLIGSTVTIAGSADLSDATFNYIGATVAVQVGTAASNMHRKRIILPTINEANKPGVGWNAGTIGVKTVRTFTCDISVPTIYGFETGLLVSGDSGGTAYSTFHVGYLNTNKRNLVMDPGATGYVNQNTFIAGRYGIASAEGSFPAGSRHILLVNGTNRVNNCLWINPSIEGDPEYMLDIEGGDYNQFQTPRFEASTGNGTIRFGANTTRNTVIGGYQLHTVTVTRVAGELYNSIQNNSRFEIYGSSSDGMLRLRNSSSAGAPALSIQSTSAAIADLATAWSWRFSANDIKGKRDVDTESRILLDSVNGRVYFGNGTVAATAYIGNLGSSADVTIGAGSLCFSTDNAYDLGRTSTFRPRDLNLARNAVIGGALDHNGTTVGFYGATPVTQPVANADTSGADLATLEAEVNQIKALLRSVGLMAT